MLAPWAVLLCKFNDDATEPHPVDWYERLFTAAGTGSENMVDFFRDMSHGNVDIGGSKVFGWLTIPHPRSDYAGSGANDAGRQQLIQWARDAAAAKKIDLTPFFRPMVVMNVATDLFGGGAGAVSSPDNTVPSLLGQEMGHGFGLAHSRIDGSTTDYMDPWDIMSTAGPYEASHPTWVDVGPGMNAANMDGRGWLDGSRVWSGSAGTIQLRPLHRRDLNGWLCARVGEFYVELRVRDRWDRAIPSPTVLVHRFEDNHSYLMRGTSGSAALGPNDRFEQGSSSMPWERWVSVAVDDIDPNAQVATVSLIDRAADRPPVAGPGEIFGGIAHDGGGWIFVNGHIHRVPPRSPVLELLEQLSQVQSSLSIARTTERTTQVQATYRRLAATIAGRFEDEDHLESPPLDPFDGRFDGFEDREGRMLERR